MFRKILIPLDGSAEAERALDFVANLKVKEVLLLRVSDMPFTVGPNGEFPFPLEVCDDDRADCQEYLIGVGRKLVGMAVQTLACACEPVGGILSIAKSEGCDLILMTSHGRTGLNRLLMGSVAEKVMRQASCPVMVCSSHRP